MKVSMLIPFLRWSGIVSVRVPIKPIASPVNSKILGIFKNLIAYTIVSIMVLVLASAETGPAGPNVTALFTLKIPRQLIIPPRGPIVSSDLSSLLSFE